MKRSLNDSRSFLAHYAHALRMAAGETSRTTLLALAVLDFTAVIAVTALIFLVASFVRLLEFDDDVVTIQVFEYAFEFQYAAYVSDGGLIVLYALSILVLLGYASASAFAVSRGVEQIGGRVQALVANTIMSRLEQVGALPANRFTRTDLQLAMTRGSMQYRAATTNLFKSFRPLLIAVFGGAAIIVLEPVLGIVVFAFGALGAPVVVLVARRIYRDSRTFYGERTPARSRALRQRIDRALSTSLITDPETDELAAADMRELDAYVRGMTAIRLAAERMRLTFQVIRAVGLAFCFALFAWVVIVDERSWSAMTAFFMFIYFVSNSVESLASNIGTLVRLMPSTWDARELMESLRPGEASAVDPERNGAVAGHAPVTLSVAVIDDELDKATVASLWAALIAAGVDGETGDTPPFASVRALGITGVMPAKAAEADFRNLVAAASGGSPVADAEGTQTLPNPALKALRVLCDLVAGGRTHNALVSWQILNKIPRPAWRQIFDCLELQSLCVIGERGIFPNIAADRYFVRVEREAFASGNAEWFEQQRCDWKAGSPKLDSGSGTDDGLLEET